MVPLYYRHIPHKYFNQDTEAAGLMRAADELEELLEKTLDKS